MSASYRSIARMPVHLFQNLIPQENEHKNIDVNDPERIRNVIISKLLQIGVTTVGDLLHLSSPSLLRALCPFLTHDYIKETCQILINRISNECAASPLSALELLKQTSSSSPSDIDSIRYLPTGIDTLDKNLNGGLRIQNLTEIVGRAGVGKTQLGMQLCVTAAILEQGSIYIDTECKMSLMRMEEIADGRYQSNFSSNNKYKKASEVLSNVVIHSPRSTKEMQIVISNLEEDILIRNENPDLFPIRLVVLDSIAAPTRRDFGTEKAQDRVSALFHISQVLKRMADQLQLVVVVINQVGVLNKISNDDNHNNDGSDFVAVSAALGVSWHHCVSTRLLLEHERDPHREASDLDLAQEAAMADQSYDHNDKNHLPAWSRMRGFVRTVSVVKSNVVDFSRMFYEINKEGIQELL